MGPVPWDTFPDEVWDLIFKVIFEKKSAAKNEIENFNPIPSPPAKC